MDAYELTSRESEHVKYIVFGIDVAIFVFPMLRINFAKIYRDSEVFLSITLLFGRMFSLVKIFH